eukprot:CAMPEP_0202864494 /NCGR_PEP_ID=MMETSP1391-20130828/4711_1 /ASSEMBLY_ACC=CAM_ASM_000867 /TAXON_ID=1034604 /ORGANISM="Chlamydomonas leiostraca, Strain SAG 11-49" /LENGTH=66 /DNA_ID=CAMNT_0049544239 /DNA_START=51 /DNA_END=251 /DNA_ORIENTATION=+
MESAALSVMMLQALFKQMQVPIKVRLEVGGESFDDVYASDDDEGDEADSASGEWESLSEDGSEDEW